MISRLLNIAEFQVGLKHPRRSKGFALATAGMLALGGCAMGPVVYRPNAPIASQPTFPLRVTVPPFIDATKEEPTRKKTLSIPLVVLNDQHWVNVTRSYGHSSAYFSTNAWGKALASELQGSGLFKEVLFDVEGQAEKADLMIEGTVTESTLYSQTIGVIFMIVYVGGAQDFTFTLKARRPGDPKPFWEGTIARHLKGGNGEKRITEILRGMMSEITQQLVKGLEAHRAEWSTAPPPASDSGASVDDILRSISR